MITLQDLQKQPFKGLTKALDKKWEALWVFSTEITATLSFLVEEGVFDHMPVIKERMQALIDKSPTK